MTSETTSRLERMLSLRPCLRRHYLVRLEAHLHPARGHVRHVGFNLTLVQEDQHGVWYAVPPASPLFRGYRPFERSDRGREGPRQ